MPQPAAIGTIISKCLAARGMAAKVREAGMTGRWAELVGSEIAAHAKAVKIETGRLFVSVDEPAWRQELMYQKPAILAKLNAEAGGNEPVVTDIMFIGP
ncbi:MAG: DUF721 domain-containing protein [candidate division Zixibacteria bacterium]|nr:DUF721 domain-containing protein [candidate division Zixibacteria bacterium]